jgi:hypothetical protein
MESMLNADKKSRGGFYYLLPLFLLVGGLAAYFWWPTNARPSVKTTLAIQVSEKPETKTKETPLATIVSESPFKQIAVKSVVLPTQAVAAKQITEAASVKENVTAPAVSVPINNDLSMKLEENMPSVKSTGPQALSNESPVVTSSPATNNLPEIDNTPANATPLTVLAVPTGEINLPQTNTVERTPVRSETAAGTAVNAQAESVSEKTKPSEKQTRAEENSSEQTTVIKPSQVLTTVQSLSTTASAEEVKDSVAGKTLPAENFTPVIVPEATSFLFFDLGGTYQLGYADGGNREANDFNPSFGLSLMNTVRRQWDFKLGIQYQSVRSLSFSKHVSKVTRYGLGEDNQVTVITPSTLHYVYMPVGISYRLSDKNVFSAQYRLGYLLNVSSKVETYNEHFNYTDNYKTYRTAGYTEGFALFDSQIDLGYRRQISKDLWLNADIYVGLTDIKNNTFFGSQVFERNSGIKISLMYQLFKK